MFVDFVHNGQAHGEIGQYLQETRYDVGLKRPYKDKDGIGYVDRDTGQMTFNEDAGEMRPVYEKVPISYMVNNGFMDPVGNATTLLRKDEWKLMDRAVLKAARLRMTAWNDLASRNSFGGFNGMSKTILEHETISDNGVALMDMDGLTEGRSDKPLFQNEGLPLPITHSNFWIPQRKLAVSRAGNTPIDMTMAENAGTRVGELVEEVTIGTKTGVTFGVVADYGNTPTVYGYTNHPDRNTKTDMTAPTGSNGTVVLTEWLALRELLYADRHYGPYVGYVSDNYDQFLDDEFKTNSGLSLRQRLEAIPNISAIKRLDFQTTANIVLLVQMTPNVARAVNGMAITTIQWQTHGGMKTEFKVMAILVPQLRSDFNGRCGIAHGTTS